MRRASLFCLAAALILTLYACTPPPSLSEDDLRDGIDQEIEALHKVSQPTPLLASGSAELSHDGLRHYFSVDLRSDGAGTFRADWYGPLGTVVATIRADSLGGVAVIGNKEYRFFRHRTIDDFPFMAGTFLTFGELLAALEGRVPLFVVELVRSRPPDSLIPGRRTISVIWKTDSLTVAMEVGRLDASMRRIRIHLGMNDTSHRMVFGDVRDGVAREIELRGNDGNYFRVRYGTMRNDRGARIP